MYDQELASIIARRFISRRDAKAKQRSDGQYGPDRDSTGADKPWSMGDLADHLDKRQSFGHYLLDHDNKAKLFCLDVDLIDGPGFWVSRPDLALLGDVQYDHDVIEQWFLGHTHHMPVPSVRAAWRDRSHPGREWWKFQMRYIAEMFTSRIRRHLGLPTAAAYSGHKGIHVYGFTGHRGAAEIRGAAEALLRSFGFFEPTGASTGASAWKYSGLSIEDGFGNFTIEVYPKQDRVSPGHYGNLVRLPLGRNLKAPDDPTFFLDQRGPHTAFSPHPDPVGLLTSGNPWSAS